MEPRALAAHLNRLARQKGWSEQGLCKEAKVHKDTVRNMRKKNTMAAAPKLKALTGALGVRLDDLMSEPGASEISALPHPDTAPDSPSAAGRAPLPDGASPLGSGEDMQGDTVRAALAAMVEENRAIRAERDRWQALAEGRTPPRRGKTPPRPR